MSFSPLIQQLISALRCLPGVGPKSAQRMAFYLLERDNAGAIALAEILQTSVANIGRCKLCRTLSEDEICSICQSGSRDNKLLCVLESPVDVLAIEQTGGYKGLYFVLSGHLSPIDGIGPEDLGINLLLERLEAGGVEELILATNPTVEGEATAHFIASQAKHMDIKVSRIAHGVPLGGELEFIDGGTLIHALDGRRDL